MENVKEIFLTGTLLQDLKAELTKERKLQCVLKVKTHNVYFVLDKDKEEEKTVYTVKVCSHLTKTLFENATKGNRLTVPGLLIPGTAGIRAQVLYKA